MRNKVIISFYLIWAVPLYSAIGIMGALDEEIQLLKSEMKITKTDTIAQRIFYKGSVHNKEIILVKAGVGKVNSALTTQLLIDKFKVDKIIFTGIAGAINPAISPGDIVIATQVTYHDFGTIHPDSFVPYDFIPIPADSELVEIANQSAQSIKFDTIPQEITGTKAILPKIFLGTIVTGDQFIASEVKRKWLEKTFSAYATEMEGAAVAHVCRDNKIPFVIIRSMSDLANEDARIDIEKFISYTSHNSAMIVIKMINKLQRR